MAAPEPFQPSEYAVVADATAHVTLEVTVVNGTATSFDPTLVFVTAQSGREEASQVVDSANGVDGAPLTTVLPGREVVFRVGFGVADPEDLVVEVTPEFDREPAIFTS